MSPNSLNDNLLGLTMTSHKTSDFISLEWIFGGSKDASIDGGKKGFDPESSNTIEDWIYGNTKNGKLNDNVELREERVHLRGHYASLFRRNGSLIHDVLSEFKKDYSAYEQILHSNRSALIEFGKSQNALQDDLHSIANPETTFEEVKDVIMKYQGASKRFYGHSALSYRFHEPSQHFLGDYETGFLSHEHFFESNQQLGKYETAELEGLTKSNKDAVVKLAFDIGKLVGEIEELDEEVGSCIDMTDSPIRGFIDEINDDATLMGILSPFTEHGMVEEDHNAGLLDVLKKRVENLNGALWHYVKESSRR